MTWALRSRGALRAKALRRYWEAGITVNCKAVPFDERPPMNPSELRIGTPALTTRGMVQEDRREIARIIVVALGDFEVGLVLERSRVLVERHPLYPQLPTP